MFELDQTPVVEHPHPHLRRRIDRAQNRVKGAEKEGFPALLREAVEFSRVKFECDVEELVFERPVVEKLLPPVPVLQVDLSEGVH